MRRCVGLILIFSLLLNSIAAFATGQEIIKPGQKVRLICEEEPSLNRDYTITNDGLIVLSFIGAISVTGLTEKAASDKISAKLVEERILRKATVTIKILGGGAALPVRFGGAVKLNGEIPYRAGMRLSDVAAIAEPTDAADLEHVQIEPSTGEKIVVNYKKFDGTAMEFNPELKPGDRVFFPAYVKAQEVYVLGTVRRPGVLKFEDGLTLRDAIEKAGGYAANAALDQVKIVRAGQSTTYDLTKNNVNEKLKAGDQITVGLMRERKFVRVEGQVNLPGMVPFTEGMTVSQAIGKAGGATKKAKLDKVKLMRQKAKTLTLDVGGVYKGLKGDVPLLPDDKIDVPKVAEHRRRSGVEMVGLILLGILIIGR